MTSTSRRPPRAALPASAALLAVVSALVAGCGKTDSALVVVREDPRIGPIQLAPPPRDDRPLPAVYPLWDRPTEANGFSPVPPVDRHPPMAPP